MAAPGRSTVNHNGIELVDMASFFDILLEDCFLFFFMLAKLPGEVVCLFVDTLLWGTIVL